MKLKLEETQSAMDELKNQVAEKETTLKALTKASSDESKKLQKLQTQLTNLNNQHADAEAEETRIQNLLKHAEADEKKFSVIIFNFLSENII